MKYIYLLVCLFSCLKLMAQDKIFLESGDTLQVIISQRDDKQVVYVPYDDPEFNTTTISTDRVKKIQLHNGKVIDFKKSKYPRYYAGLCLGNGVPGSDFANNDPYNSRSGYAKNKVFLSFEARMPLFRFVGLAGDVSVGGFGVDDSKYFSYLSQKDNPSSVYVSGKLADYRYATFSIGPDLGFNLGRRFKLFFPIQFSAISISTKGSDEIHYQNGAGTIQRDENRTSKGSGAGFVLGTKVDFVIAKHFGVGLTFNIHDYGVDMKVQESYSDLNTINYKWRQNVTYAYAGINLHYHFK